ncbi:MAG: DUF4294 domain-containing protein [Paludibacteraceae bacterium]|nr:DUF4294 domain-containing protein [Paludibacteraceae bacterium]
MRKSFFIGFMLFFGICTLHAEERIHAQVTPEGDTIGVAFLRDVYVYPRMRFKNKRQERFYWKTVRDVKKTLPYAKILAKEMEKTNELMKSMNRRQKRKFWKQYEKLLFQRYEGSFRDMTASQGQMLMKLIDRETGSTSYDVIELYKGSLAANFWQGLAKMFGNDLKAEYDGADKDQITERIILLVEAGQL